MTGTTGIGVRLSGVAVALLAVAAGGAIANDYALQPALAAIAADLGAPLALIALVAAAAMAGYLLGLILLVPLVDRVGARTLITSQLLALGAALVAAAAAPGAGTLIGCFVAIGAATTVAAQASAIVGKYSGPTRRAYRMGAVSAGISAGILLSRFVGGLLTDELGWRAALLVFAAFAVVCAIAAAPLLPAQVPERRVGYLNSLQSLPALLRDSHGLRRSTAAGMLWFFAFNVVWVGLVICLAAPPYGQSSAAIGLYSLAGVLGLAVTRLAGRLADRYGTRVVMTTALTTAALSALALTITLGQPGWSAVTLALFDAGCFAAQVANQARVVAIDPERSGALNAAYLTCYYAAGATGTAIAGTLAANAGWPAVTLTVTAAVSAAAILTRTR
ncbi:MFS transporter [Fodinicola acaciae]|uniref:MFS transporter n=1 Tax=Fodinicola acaciae TaxID=2681555 RepID=UPI001C9EA055|nr:MFS transporter [Fodinicola acaciae]